MVDPRDLRPQGDPETVVCLPTSTLLGLQILGSRFGPTTLGIREDLDGEPLSCAVTNELRLNIPQHGYGHVEHEDDGA